MKTVLAALALAVTLAGAAHAGQGTAYTTGLPSWAQQAFDSPN